ncbi:hypothetical protein PT520_09710 [Aliarcobacter butzleri]|uniref:Large polyvalent protein associated domain-containing protein n=1 Tax=Aliarcobacter butzleri TaxID=28197 RepID=A0AAW6VPQ3_9BACT|nr:hypothetical protein [Aliarcobacter butzleri]MDK2062792.1 hypothetical protein [Aliarcobacter butzleri]
MNNIQLPDGWEEVQKENIASIIPDGWQEVGSQVQVNQNPFIQQGEEGYNNQVHTMDMDAINNSVQKINEPKSFLDTVKDFGFNILNGFKKGADATAEPFVNAIQKSQDTLIKPIANNPVVRAVEDTANFFTPIGEFDFASQYDKKEDFANKAIQEQDLPLSAYNDINKLANTDLTLFANAKDGKDTYNENLAKIVIDKFGFDDLGIGEDGKYYATKGNEVVQLNKDSLAEITSSIYGDKMEILGSIIGAKKGYDVGKNFGTKGKFVGSLAGGAIGAGAGTVVDMLDSIISNGEKLNATQILDEVGKSAALDAGAGLVTAGVIKGGGTLIDMNPWTIQKKADAYINDVLKVNDNPEAEKQIVENAQAFGGKGNQDLTKLATFDETQKSLTDLYDNSVEARNAVRADNEALTTNLFNKLNIDEIKTDNIANTNEKIAGNISGEVSGIENYWNDLYVQTKDDIVKIAGNDNIPIKPTTVDTVNKNIKSLETVDNVQKRSIEPDKLNEFQKDYSSMLDAIQINLKQEVPTPDGQFVKEDVNSYTLTGMMDLQKKFNDFFYKHEDKLTSQQKKNLGEIKTSIYDDIENYIGYKFDGDAQTAKMVKDKWAEVNSDLGNWKKTKGRQKILQDIIDSKVDINQLTSKFISDTGNIDKDGFDMLGNIGYQLSKTNPEKLDEFYGSIVNNMLESTKIKETVNQQDVRYLDFEKFNKLYDDLRGQTLNKTFGRTQRGKEILNTLDTFRELAKNEEKIQNAVLKNQTPLSESGRTSKENTRVFLFGVSYAIRHRLLGYFSKRMFKSDAFHSVVTDMAKNRRYGLKEFDDSISKLQYQNEKLPVNKKFSEDEIEDLIGVRKEIEAFKSQRENEFNSLKDILKDIDSLEEKRLVEEQFIQESKREAQMLEEKTKANMLLEHKAIIPPVQIKEGAKEPLPLDIQDRISVANTKQPSIEPVGKTKPTTFDNFTSTMGIDKNEIIKKVEQENNTKQVLENPVFNQDNLKLTAPKDGKYNFDDLVEFEGIVKATGDNPADVLQMDKFTNMKGIRNALTRYSEGNPTARDIEILDSIQRFMDNEGDRFKTKVDDTNPNFDKEFEEADKAGNIPFSSPTVGGASIGAASGTQTDFNQDGKVDEVDVMIGTLIGTIGIKKTMDIFPQHFKK